MKTLRFFFLLCVAVMAVSFQQTPVVHKLYPGLGMDDDIRFKVSRREQITEKFGKDFKEVRHYYHEEGSADSSLQFIEQRYETYGISFFYRQDTAALGAIRVRKPFAAVTDKGLSLGKAVIDDADAIYGIGEWQYTDRSMFKEYKGLACAVAFDGKFPVSKTTQTAAQKKKITEFDVYPGVTDIFRTNEK